MGRKRTKPRKQTEFSRRLHQIRKSKKITMMELSKRIDISDSYISLLESGERKPSRDVVIKLAEAFFPDGNGSAQTAQDELLILAGFTPINTDSLKLPPAPVDLIFDYEMTLKDNPTDFSTFMILIRTLIKEHQYDKAQTKLMEGLHIFGRGVQLQTMLAHIELTKGNHIGAIVAQEAALKHYDLCEAEERGRLTKADLLANLSIIHFLKGDTHLSQKQEAEYQGDEELAQKSKQQAITHYLQASENLEKALEEIPDNLTWLDDIARINFNLADLSESRKAKSYWHKTIAAYRQILASEHKHSLGDSVLTEVTLFLAHAYTKSAQFDLASYTLDLLTTFHAKYWLIYYVRACYYSLRFEHDNDKALLDRALEYIKLALQTDKEQTSHQITYDQDLKALRNHRASMLQELVGDST